jgi:hypothetical protein
VERLVEIASYLRQIGDDSEDWGQRLAWLNSLLAELWKGRGLYPGLARVMDLLGMAEAVQPFRVAAGAGQEKEFKAAVFDWLDEKTTIIPGVTPTALETARVRRQWKLREAAERDLLAEVLPRFDLPKDQMERILADDRAESCLLASLTDIRDNPYVLAEQFVGTGPDDLFLTY